MGKKLFLIIKFENQSLECFKELELKECLRTFNKKTVPTSKNPRDGKVVHQIDHQYVTDFISKTLQQCTTGEAELIFGNSLPAIEQVIPA
jgi:hypothetical protein